ncbi:hypothetical protein ACWD00_04360 [Streptomyces viridiviolaceus]
MPDRTRSAERYTRGLAAGVAAVAALVLAANMGPARAAEERPTGGGGRQQVVGGPRDRCAPDASAPPAPAAPAVRSASLVPAAGAGPSRP